MAMRVLGASGPRAQSLPLPATTSPNGCFVGRQAVATPSQTAGRSELRIKSPHSRPSTTRCSAAGTVEAEATEAVDKRKYFSLLPPFLSRPTVMEEHGPGLWTFAQPLKPPGQADIRLRMTAARLDNGDLVLLGPVAPTLELLDMLRVLGGEVTHIVIPNTSPEHFFFAPALSAAFPAATLWTPPGFYEGKGVPLPGRSLLFSKARARNPQRTLGLDPWPPELQGQLEAVVLDVPFFMEAALVLPRHGALLLADTGICLSAADPEYAGMSAMSVRTAQSMGLYDRLGPVTKLVFERYPEAGRAWVEEVLRLDFEVLLPGHGSAPVTNGRQAFAACFDFLYGGDEQGALVAAQQELAAVGQS